MSNSRSYLEAHLHEYDAKGENLKQKLHELNDKRTLLSSIEEKSHFSYLVSYLNSEKGVGAKFFFVEEGYVNKDYLVDYSHYYSFCFEDYKKKSARIHFFRCEADGDGRAYLLGKIEECLSPECTFPCREFFEENYIGCIVVNPIPNTFLGYTLLKHYNCFHKNPERFFWGTREYFVHLLGNEIPINTLAFHEQDANVGACATMAVWSVFQKAAEDYYVKLKSPIEITRDAGLIRYTGDRMFPNKGLIVPEICTALTKNNLVTETRVFDGVNDSNYLKRFLYAYSSLGLPMVLLVLVPEESEYVGHAIAVCGHRFGGDCEQSFAVCEETIVSRADSISQLYCHDDQWGPFVDMSFILEEDLPSCEGMNRLLEEIGLSVSSQNIIDSEWTKETENGEKYYAVLRGVIVPTFPKVRIDYDTIESMVLELQFCVVVALENQNSSPCENIVWDIRARYSEEFKQELKQLRREECFLSTDEEFFAFKFNALTQSLPKYIWVATSYTKSNRLCSFIFDATGLTHCQSLLHVLFYDPSPKQLFQSWLEANIGMDYVKKSPIYPELNRAFQRDSFFL